MLSVSPFILCQNVAHERARQPTGLPVPPVRPRDGGGDPLHPANRLDIRALVHEIREKFPTKTIWLYTGYLWEQISHFEVMQYVDVCVDGEYEKDKRNVQLHWKGSSNQRVIDVPKSLETGKVCLYCE